MSTSFGSVKYSKEELVAEMGSAILGAEFGIEPTPIDNHAAYIQGWMEKIKSKDGPKTFITAASEASKAVRFLHGERSL